MTADEFYNLMEEHTKKLDEAEKNRISIEADENLIKIIKDFAETHGLESVGHLTKKIDRRLTSSEPHSNDLVWADVPVWTDEVGNEFIKDKTGWVAISVDDEIFYEGDGKITRKKIKSFNGKIISSELLKNIQKSDCVVCVNNLGQDDEKFIGSTRFEIILLFGESICVYVKNGEN